MKRTKNLMTIPMDFRPASKFASKSIYHIPLGKILVEAIGAIITIIAVLTCFGILAAMVDVPHPVANDNGGVTWAK